jgi:AraC-like DNA-binding protein
MATTLGKDRLRTLIDVLLESLDRPAGGEELARRVYLSRFHFDRLVAAALGESPGAFRRRLLLERAAWRLSTGDSVGGAAFDAGYSSAEAFARAFRRAFGSAPSLFDGDFRLAAPNGVHFHPPGGLLVPGDDPGRETMDLVDRLLDHDLWLTCTLIEAAEELPEHALDEPVQLAPPTAAFAGEAPSIREMLERLVFTKEMWSAAIAGRELHQDDDSSPCGLKRRLETSGREFAELVRGIRNRNAWDTAFVDATCEPPESFTLGGAVAHALAWDAHRRQVVTAAMRERGAHLPSPDPLAWERERA